jgi:hypothetical protein
MQRKEKMLLLLSPQTGAGVNVIAVNLAIGLTRYDHLVLLGSADQLPVLTTWLEYPGNYQNTLLGRHPNLKWQQQLEMSEYENINGKPMDYLVYITGEEEKTLEVWKKYRPLVLCIVDAGKDNMGGITSIDKRFRSYSTEWHGIDLVIPNKARPGEWEKSSRLLSDLAQLLGWERLADPIPYCEAIHDLPLGHKSVWDLPMQYSNRQEAFQRLVEKVMGLPDHNL